MSQPEKTEKIYGTLVVDGYAGRTRHVVEVIGQTAKRLRIRAVTKTRLAGRRELQVGETALVPTYAVRDNCEECGGKMGGVPGNENRVGIHILCDYCSGRRRPAPPRTP